MKDMLKRGVFVILFLVLVNSAYSLIGDFDLNNEVNFNDFVQFARAFGEFNVENSEGETFYDSHFDLNNDGIISIEDFFVFADNFGKTNETNVSERIFATKPLAFIPVGSPGVPGLAALYGDLNADNCVKQNDLDKWRIGRNRGAFDASVLRTVHDLDFNADTLIDNNDEKIILDNMGKCFEKDFCSEKFEDEEERNKCLILSATKPFVINGFCVDENSENGFSNLCSNERMNLCNLIRDSVNLQNELNLKEICHNRYELYLQGVQSNAGIGFK